MLLVTFRFPFFPRFLWWVCTVRQYEGNKSYCGCVLLQMPLGFFFWAKRGIDVKLNMKGIHYVYRIDERQNQKEERGSKCYRTKEKIR